MGMIQKIDTVFTTRRAIVCLWLTMTVPWVKVSGCDRCGSEQSPQSRTLVQAREIVLDLFQKLDGFALTKQTEVEVSGSRAVRMEGRWSQGGQERRCVIMLVDNPGVFNVIHYTAPSANNLFEVGYDIFDRVLAQIKSAPYTGRLEVIQDSDHKRLRSSDLQLEIRYPLDWIYTVDEDNHSVVLSGPKEKPTWLTTITFSVVHKWEK